MVTCSKCSHDEYIELPFPRPRRILHMTARLDGGIERGGLKIDHLEIPQTMSKRAWLVMGTFQVREDCAITHR